MQISQIIFIVCFCYMLPIFCTTFIIQVNKLQIKRIIYAAILSCLLKGNETKWRRKLQFDQPVHVTIAISARVTVYVIKLVTQKIRCDFNIVRCHLLQNLCILSYITVTALHIIRFISLYSKVCCMGSNSNTKRQYHSKWCSVKLKRDFRHPTYHG